MSQALITDDDKTPLVGILVWVFLVLAILAVTARVATKLMIIRTLALDDFLIIVSTILAICQSIAVALQTSNGLGRHLNTLTAIQISTALKSEYAANLLFIASVCLAKLSVVAFIEALTPVPLYNRLILGLGATTVLWAVSAELAAAFQCHLPAPWEYLDGRCFDRTAFWTYFAIMNMVTDAGLVLIMAIIATRLNTSLAKKLTIAGMFSARILVIAAIAFQVIYLRQASNSQDPTFDLWPLATATQAVQCLSILTACIPYLRPFLESLESGLMRADDLRRRGGTGGSGYDGRDSNGLPHSTSSSNRKDPDRPRGKLSWFAQTRSTKGSAGSRTRSQGVTLESHAWDAQSQSSRSAIVLESRSRTMDEGDDEDAETRIGVGV